jgi:hypothetical protein
VNELFFLKMRVSLSDGIVFLFFLRCGQVCRMALCSCFSKVQGVSRSLGFSLCFFLDVSAIFCRPGFLYLVCLAATGARSVVNAKYRCHRLRNLQMSLWHRTDSQGIAEPAEALQRAQAGSAILQDCCFSPLKGG